MSLAGPGSDVAKAVSPCFGLAGSDSILIHVFNNITEAGDMSEQHHLGSPQAGQVGTMIIEQPLLTLFAHHSAACVH